MKIFPLESFVIYSICESFTSYYVYIYTRSPYPYYHFMTIEQTSQILDQLAPTVSSSINLKELMPFLQKHGLVTNDENYRLTSAAIAPREATQLLLRTLKSKGDGTLQKFLCSLNSATQHSGHKDIAIKLTELINRYHQGFQVQFCSLCMPHS